eukprot:5655544-Pleurochrysis_carterae.AAC.1
MLMYHTDIPGTNCAVELSPLPLFSRLHPELTRHSMSAIHQSMYKLAIFPINNSSEEPVFLHAGT